MIVVSDTSPITSLLQIEHAHLLQDIFGTIYIPNAVRDELREYHREIPSFVLTKAVADPARVSENLMIMDLGEAEALALAQEISARILIIDEQAGRRAAIQTGVPVTGLLGILLTAKSQRLIPSVAAVMTRLERVARFRVSPTVKAEVLKAAREV